MRIAGTQPTKLIMTNTTSLIRFAAIVIMVGLWAGCPGGSYELGQLADGGEPGTGGSIGPSTASGGVLGAGGETSTGGSGGTVSLTGSGGSPCPPLPSCNWCHGQQVVDATGCVTGWRCANGADPCQVSSCEPQAPPPSGYACGSDGLYWPAAATGGAPGTGGSGDRGGDTGSGGTAGSAGTTVLFENGKAQGAMTGYAWVALGAADTLTDPTCGPEHTPITNATPCSTTVNWSTPDKVCLSGSIPMVSGSNPDFASNWGMQIGVAATDPQGGPIGQMWSAVGITMTGSPLSGLRVVLHRKGDPEATQYCATLTTSAPIPITSFSTECWLSGSLAGIRLTAADAPLIDAIGVQVSSVLSSAITVNNLCLTGITFSR